MPGRVVPRAVDRVDDPHPVGVALDAALLAADRVVGEPPAELLADHRLDGEVGLGDRRGVGLPRDLGVVAEEGQRDLAGAIGQLVRERQLVDVGRYRPWRATIADGSGGAATDVGYAGRHMQTTVENTDKHTVKLTIEVPVDEFTKDLDRAYRSISNQVKIPGFRKGKVPKKIIDAQIGRDVVREEFLSSSVPTYFRDAVREEDLAPDQRSRDPAGAGRGRQAADLHRDGRGATAPGARARRTTRG